MSFLHKPVFSSLTAAAIVTAFAVVACEDGSTSGGTVPPPEAGAGFDGGAPGQGSDGGGAPVVDCPAPTAGPTAHKGDVAANEVWSAAGSPHVLDYNVNVREGAKLVIEPCAEVQLAKGVRIQVAYPLTPNTGALRWAHGPSSGRWCPAPGRRRRR